MTARPVATIAGPNAQVLDHLLHLVEMGRHLGTQRRPAWTAADVVRVAYEHLPHAHTLARRLRAETARADRAEAEVHRLRARLEGAAPLTHRRREWSA